MSEPAAERAFAARRSGRERRALVSFSLLPRLGPRRRRSRAPPSRRSCPGSLKNTPLLDSLDTHRRGRRDHRVHRQGGAGPGHQDRASCRWRRKSSTSPLARIEAHHRRYGPHARTRATPRAASPCRTARRRSATPRRRCARSSRPRPRRARRCRRQASRPRAAPCAHRTGAALAYGELVAGATLHVRGATGVAAARAEHFKVIGQSFPRVDIPAKVTGVRHLCAGPAAAGMVHARVVRPPSYGAQLRERGYGTPSRRCRAWSRSCGTEVFSPSSPSANIQAIKAMRALAEAAQWEEKPRPAGRDRSAAFSSACPHRTPAPSTGRRRRAGARTLRGDLHAALSDAWLDRSVLRRRPLTRRWPDGLDPQPGRLSRSQGDRRNAAPAGRAASLHPCGRLGLLWP